MRNDIVQKSEAFIRQLFDEKLTDDFRFHDLAHTESVVKYTAEIGNKKEVSEEGLEILLVAAWFHDSGYTERYAGHEFASCRIAKNFLEEHQYPESKINNVINCIEATQPDYVPQNELQEILKDADLNNLGLDSFYDLSIKLRHEWDVLCDTRYSDLEWLENNFNFLSNHKYYTKQARKMFKDGKKENLKKMKTLIKMAKENIVKEKTPIEGSKATQMMFKTSLRNHIDLTGIADNKANMMLSINALIITIAMPLLASNLKENKFLLIPTLILLLTCILSVIFATLATRPGKMLGNINFESLKKGNSNIFFFGNFYEMSLDKYRDAVDIVIKDETIMEKSIVNDLYFLGRALGTKYSQLRACYLIFMVGMTATVIAFMISFLYSN